MSFVEQIHENLYRLDPRPPVSEITPDGEASLARVQFAESVSMARGALTEIGLLAGQRVALVGPSDTHWVAADLALLFEGLTSVAVDPGLPDGMLGSALADAAPDLVIVADPETWHRVESVVPLLPLLDYARLFEGSPKVAPPHPVIADDIVTVVYPSNTNRAYRGARITRANVDHVLRVFSTALVTMIQEAGHDRVFHALPLPWMASRLMVWTSLLRDSGIILGEGGAQLMTQLRQAAPTWTYLTPRQIKRIAATLRTQIESNGFFARRLYHRAESAWAATLDGKGTASHADTLEQAEVRLFGPARASLAPSLEFILCGYADLDEATQRWLAMVGVPVYRMYGQPETTGLTAIDPANGAAPGWHGYPVEGTQVRISVTGELEVRGPQVFAGYDGLPDETDAVLDAQGWLRTGHEAQLADDERLRVLDHPGEQP